MINCLNGIAKLNKKELSNKMEKIILAVKI